jgi:hypothetical protein
MSLNMIEASRSPVYRRMGCKVISVASGGERQISKNSCDSRNFRNSSYIVGMSGHFSFQSWHGMLPGRYRPACRMTQTGARSTFSPIIE